MIINLVLDVIFKPLIHRKKKSSISLLIFPLLFISIPIYSIDISYFLCSFLVLLSLTQMFKVSQSNKDLNPILNSSVLIGSSIFIIKEVFIFLFFSWIILFFYKRLNFKTVFISVFPIICFYLISVSITIFSKSDTNYNTLFILKFNWEYFSNFTLNQNRKFMAITLMCLISFIYHFKLLKTRSLIYFSQFIVIIIYFILAIIFIMISNSEANGSEWIFIIIPASVVISLLIDQISNKTVQEISIIFILFLSLYDKIPIY